MNNHITKALTDSKTTDYGWRNQHVPGPQRNINGRLLELIQKKECENILDMGCGNGCMCGMLADAGLNPVGFDTDAKGIEIARNTHPGIKFENMTMDEASSNLKHNTFDVALCSEVIEHLYTPSSVPKTAFSMLKPGGRLIITTPYHGYLKNIVLSLANKWDTHHNPLHEGGHIKFWSRKTLTSLLEHNGFSVIYFEGIGRWPLLWKSMILVATRK